MRKLFQWALLTTVGVGLLVVVVHQYFTVTTGRAREASVGALKETLDALPTAQNALASESTSVPTQESTPGTAEEYGGDAGLRERWEAFFDRNTAHSGQCDLSLDTWNSTEFIAYGLQEGPLTYEEREEVLAYRGCMAELIAELRALCHETADLGLLAESMGCRDVDTIDESFFRSAQRLRHHLIMSITLEEHADVISTLTALSVFGTLRTPRSHSFWEASNYFFWDAIDAGIQRGTVPDSDWDRLLFRLKRLREQALFADAVRRDAEQVVYTYENWTEVERDLKFRDHPVTFLRTWAYPRITTALFNHDIDRFSRAMNILLDLSHIPYYEAREELETFYSEFDVEPSPHQIKFIRGNPAWYYIVSLSRKWMRQEASKEAALDLMQFAILLDRHQRATGSYPESLAVFAEYFGGEVPVSPLDGQPYVYERIEDTFRLGFREDWGRHFVEELGHDPTYVREWHDPLMSPFEGIERPPGPDESGE